MVHNKMNKKIFVVTGAYSSGKTTTLNHLQKHYNYNIHKEAHLIVLDKLKDRIQGHLIDQEYKKINNPEHFCPMCHPLEFAKLVLDKQLEIESNANNFDILERGYIDPIEYYLRNTGKNSFPLEYNKGMYSKYLSVFLFEVIPEVQISKWAKSKEKRIYDAYYINERLYKMYKDEGFNVHLIKKDTIHNRSKMLHELITEYI